MAEGRLRQGLRRLFSDDSWQEFVADFGTRGTSSQTADVFPSVVPIRKRMCGLPPPEEAVICVIRANRAR